MDRIRLSRWIVLGAVVLAGGPIAAVAEGQEAQAAQQGQEQQVDPATKQLLAANGLYTRGLYKLAADEYQQFLSQNSNHAQATAARYALAVWRDRVEEDGGAGEGFREVFGGGKVWVG